MIDGPNEYTYVRQNPWTSFDPEGLAAGDGTWSQFLSWDGFWDKMNQVGTGGLVAGELVGKGSYAAAQELTGQTVTGAVPSHLEGPFGRLDPISNAAAQTLVMPFGLDIDHAGDSGVVGQQARTHLAFYGLSTLSGLGPEVEAGEGLAIEVNTGNQSRAVNSGTDDFITAKDFKTKAQTQANSQGFTPTQVNDEGGYFYPTANAKGGTFWQASGPITGSDINDLLAKINVFGKDDVKLFSGAHGDAGVMQPEARFFKQDAKNFTTGGYSGSNVSVDNILTTAPETVNAAANGPGHTIAGWCNSNGNFLSSDQGFSFWDKKLAPLTPPNE